MCALDMLTVGVFFFLIKNEDRRRHSTSSFLITKVCMIQAVIFRYQTYFKNKKKDFYVINLYKETRLFFFNIIFFIIVA